MKKVIAVFLLLTVATLTERPDYAVARAMAGQAQQTPSVEELDRLLAPVALYPDQLLGQILQASQNPGPVEALNLFINKNPTLKGTALQDDVTNAGFDATLVTLALFPQVVKMMSDQLQWTTNIGIAFTNDRSAVFASIQRLRKRAKEEGRSRRRRSRRSKRRPRRAARSHRHRAGESASRLRADLQHDDGPPGVDDHDRHHPEDDNGAEAMAAGMIGFTAGIATRGVRLYYYSPYGFMERHTTADDYYDHREDARELDGPPRGHDRRAQRRANDARRRTDRQETRQENRPESQQRQQTRETAQANRSSSTQSDRAARRSRAVPRVRRHRRTGIDFDGAGKPIDDNDANHQDTSTPKRRRAVTARAVRRRSPWSAAPAVPARSPVIRAASRSDRPASVASKAAAVRDPAAAAAAGADADAPPPLLRMCMRGAQRDTRDLVRAERRASNFCDA